jgi:hypothetical protein
MLHNGFEPIRFVSLERHFKYRGLNYVDCLCILEEDDTKSKKGYIDLGIKGQVSPETYDSFSGLYD